MKRSLFALVLFLTLPAFGGTIDKLDFAEIDDDSIEVRHPVWEGAKAGAVLVNRFESAFDRTFARKIASGFRNNGIKNQTLAPSVDLGEILASKMRSEGRLLGLTMMEPQEGAAPQWIVGGTIRDAAVEIQHVGYGSMLLYAHLDVDVTIARPNEPATVTRMRPARFFVMFNAGFGIADEAQLALAKMVLVGAQQILARLNREHFHAPALASMTERVASRRKATEQESELHHIGLSGAPGAAAALAALLEKETDENGRTAIVYALTDAGAAEQVPLLMRRYASEDTDVRYATLLALDSTGSSEGAAFIREQAKKEKNVPLRKVAEWLAE